MDYVGLGLLLGAGFVVWVILTAWHTVRTLTRPPRRGYAYALAKNLPTDPAELAFTGADSIERVGVPFEQFTFRSRGLELGAWDIRGFLPASRTIVLTHGWGDSRVISLARAPILLQHCSRLVLWDLPGHADAPGRCTLGVHEPDDLIALLEALPKGGAPAVLYGHSLGAGVSIEAAARLGDARVGAVVAEAPYALPETPARNVMRLAGLPYRLNLPIAMAFLRPGFDRAEQAADLRVPLLVLHGEDDAVCPLEDARTITRRAARGTLEVVPGGGHTDLYTDPRSAPHVAASLERFFASLTASEQPARGTLAPEASPTR